MQITPQTIIVVTIDRAWRGNLPALAEINRLVYCRETIAQVAFRPDDKNMFEFSRARLSERYQRSGTQVFKVLDTLTSTLAGFVCLTLEKRNEAETGSQKSATEIAPTVKIMQQLPSYMNHEFVLKSGAEIEEMKGHMEAGNIIVSVHLTTFSMNLLTLLQTSLPLQSSLVFKARA